MKGRESMEEKNLLYSLGTKSAGNIYSLADKGGSLENLINVVDYYKERAVKKSDFFLAGLADGIWDLIQDRWEYAPRGNVNVWQMPT